MSFYFASLTPICGSDEGDQNKNTAFFTKVKTSKPSKVKLVFSPMFSYKLVYSCLLFSF